MRWPWQKRESEAGSRSAGPLSGTDAAEHGGENRKRSADGIERVEDLSLIHISEPTRPY